MAFEQKQTMPQPSFLLTIADGTFSSFDQAKKAFLQDVENNYYENDLIPNKTDSIVRIMTFNVRMWTNLMDQSNFEEIGHLVKKLDPDIVIFQEVMNWQKTYEYYINLGYDAQAVSCITTDPCFGPAIFAKNCIITSSFGSIFKNQSSPQRQLSFVRLDINIRTTKISVYGTHLEVDNFHSKESMEHIRARQLEEIFNDSAQLPPDSVVIIAGDFNSVRKDDYNYFINKHNAWDIITTLYYTQLGKKIALQALNLFAKNNYRSSFELLQWQNPKFTNWFCRALDYIFFSPSAVNVRGSYVYYTPLSDHLPIIVDVKI